MVFYCKHNKAGEFMKEQIHTIPVIEALREPGLCAFCAMTRKLDEDAVRFIMGPAYMEEDVRMKTNKTGFCKKHMEAMYKEQNRLGLALMLHTHVQEINKNVKNMADFVVKPTIFGAGSDSYIIRLGGHLAATNEDCYVCQSVNSTFDRYVDTFFMLWLKGGPDAQLVQEQKGYCLYHFTVILKHAGKLGAKKHKRFLSEILPAWHESMKELEADLEWFTQKFDHKNKDEPWKNSREVLPRALAILGGDA